MLVIKMMMKEPRVYIRNGKPQFSKILPIITFVVWVCCISRGFSIDLSNILDTAIYTVSITVSGGIFGMIAKSYNSKTKAENIANIQKDMYVYATKTQLWAIEQMAIIKRYYDLSEDDVMQMKERLSIDDEVIRTYDKMNQNIDVHSADSFEVDDIQNY